jgi:mRNA interferase HigB
MHVISRKALTVFWSKYPDSKKALLRWFKIVNQTTFKDFNALKLVFPSADKVDDLVVFNIGGNNYRLIASVHFNRKKIYVRKVLTHKDYEKGDWKK